MRFGRNETEAWCDENGMRQNPRRKSIVLREREREKTTFSNSNHIELPQETLIFSLLLCKLLNSFHFQSQIFAPVKMTPFSVKLTIMIKHALFPFQCATSSNKAS